MLCRGYVTHVFEQVHARPLSKTDKVVISSFSVTMPLMVVAIILYSSL
jgi:hypothetical protein